MVCGSSGQQMVYAFRRRGGSDRNPRLTRPGVSQSGSRKTQGTRRSQKEVVEQIAFAVVEDGWRVAFMDCLRRRCPTAELGHRLAARVWTASPIAPLVSAGFR